MHVYVCMTDSLALFFFLFPKACLLMRQNRSSFSLSLSLSSWFSPLPPEVNLVIDLWEWCTSCGVGMTVLSNLLHLVCTALRSLENSLSCWLNLNSDCHHIEWSLFAAWGWVEFIHQICTCTFKQLLIGPIACVCVRACAYVCARACVCALACVHSLRGKGSPFVLLCVLI